MTLTSKHQRRNGGKWWSKVNVWRKEHWEAAAETLSNHNSSSEERLSSPGTGLRAGWSPRIDWSWNKELIPHPHRGGRRSPILLLLMHKRALGCICKIAGLFMSLDALNLWLTPKKRFLRNLYFQEKRRLNFTLQNKINSQPYSAHPLSLTGRTPLGTLFTAKLSEGPIRSWFM